MNASVSCQRVGSDECDDTLLSLLFQQLVAFAELRNLD